MVFEVDGIENSETLLSRISYVYMTFDGHTIPGLKLRSMENRIVHSLFIHETPRHALLSFINIVHCEEDTTRRPTRCCKSIDLRASDLLVVQVGRGNTLSYYALFCLRLFFLTLDDLRSREERLETNGILKFVHNGSVSAALNVRRRRLCILQCTTNGGIYYVERIVYRFL